LKCQCTNGCQLRNLKLEQLYSNAEKPLPLLNRHSVTTFADASLVRVYYPLASEIQQVEQQQQRKEIQNNSRKFRDTGKLLGKRHQNGSMILQYWKKGLNWP